MLPLTGLLLLLYRDRVTVKHRKPWAGGGSHSCPATYNLHHALQCVWLVEMGQACPGQDWAAVYCIDYIVIF